MCSGLDHLWLGCWLEGKPHVHPELWPEVTASLERAKKNALRKGIRLHYYGPGIGEPRLFRAAFEQRLKEKNPGTSYLFPPCSHCYKLLETSLNE